MNVIFETCSIAKNAVVVNKQFGIRAVLPGLLKRPNDPVPACRSKASNLVDVTGSLMKRFVHNFKQLIICVSFTVKLHPLFDLGRLINMRQISKPRWDLLAPYKIVTSEEVFFTFCIIISVVKLSPGHSIFGWLNGNPFSCILGSYLIPVSLPFCSQIIVSDCRANVFLSTVSNWFVVTINSDLIGECAFPTLIVSYSECNYVSACCSVCSTRVYR